ncbi:hypothetical protein B0A50_08022 [Salinomyces thailandicus]|uniref:BTB domain-containing protein n=1 Tax=Salinomyces thailandicus TaxID=706561 RepID=A0A4U0TKI4_9PEZI|nr:hypothetical protein B0A50_08022 [Salinomyces thailandica]
MPRAICCPNGDVEVHFTTEESVLLHSSVLKTHSEFFSVALSDRWNTEGAPLPNATTCGSTSIKKWRFELRFEQGSNEGQLYSKPTVTATELVSGKPTADRLKNIRAHKGMIRSLFDVAPVLGSSSFARAKESVELLIDTAVMYSCENAVLPYVEKHLHRFRTDVFERCTAMPVIMLELAMKTKVDWIFMEATTNLVGRSTRFFKGSKVALQKLEIVEFMERKRAAFWELLQRCDTGLLLMSTKPSDRCETLAAHAFFKMWLIELLRDVKNHSSLFPGYGNLYYEINSNATALKGYVRQQALAYWGRLYKTAAQPDPTEAELIKSFLAGVLASFQTAAAIIKPVTLDATLRQCKRVDTHRALTCMTMSKEEVPWAKD